MRLKTILNRVEHYKSFVDKQARLVNNGAGQPTLEVMLQPRANGRPICSGCHRVRPGYDRLAPRRFFLFPVFGFRRGLACGCCELGGKDEFCGVSCAFAKSAFNADFRRPVWTDIFIATLVFPRVF